MRIEYKLLERSNGDRALVRISKRLFFTRTEYYAAFVGAWHSQERWYEPNNKSVNLENNFAFFCNCGEVKVLKSCGGK